MPQRVARTKTLSYKIKMLEAKLEHQERVIDYLLEMVGYGEECVECERWASHCFHCNKPDPEEANNV